MNLKYLAVLLGRLARLLQLEGVGLDGVVQLLSQLVQLRLQQLFSGLGSDFGGSDSGLRFRGCGARFGGGLSPADTQGVYFIHGLSPCVAFVLQLLQWGSEVGDVGFEVQGLGLKVQASGSGCMTE